MPGNYSTLYTSMYFLLPISSFESFLGYFVFFIYSENAYLSMNVEKRSDSENKNCFNYSCVAG